MVTDGVLVSVKHHDFKAFTPLLDSRLFGLMYNNLTNLTLAEFPSKTKTINKTDLMDLYLFLDGY